MPKVFSKNKSLSIVPFCTVKLAWYDLSTLWKWNPFSILNASKMKKMGRTIRFTLKHIEIRKHFVKFKSIRPAEAKMCLYMCYHILHFMWKSRAGTRGRGGGGDMLQPKNPDEERLTTWWYSWNNLFFEKLNWRWSLCGRQSPWFESFTKLYFIFNRRKVLNVGTNSYYFSSLLSVKCDILILSIFKLACIVQVIPTNAIGNSTVFGFGEASVTEPVPWLGKNCTGRKSTVSNCFNEETRKSEIQMIVRMFIQ